MSSVFPLRPSIDHAPGTTAQIDLTEESSGVIEALSSETARSVVATLSQDPATASDVADEVGTSIQNAKYHLDRLVEADLVTPVGTWHSAKGNEMTVYGVANERLELSLTPASNRQH